MPKTIVRSKVLSRELSPETITERLVDRLREVAVARVSPVTDVGTSVSSVPTPSSRKIGTDGVLSSGLPETATLEEHVDALLSRIVLRGASLKALSQTSHVELSCVIHADSAPALNFDPETIERLALLGANLDIDLYV